MHPARLAAGLALALFTGSFATADAAEHLTVGGYDRTFHAYVPAHRAASPPLVVVLHGGFGTGDGAEGAYHWDELADRYGFVVLYPDGMQRAWNAGDCCGQPRARGVDERHDRRARR